MQQYSQFKALLAIAKASLRAIFRSPQSVFFSMFFPIVLIVIFGAISNGGGGISMDVAIDKKADTSNAVYEAIKHSPFLYFHSGSEDSLVDLMQKGKITALINIVKLPKTSDKEFERDFTDKYNIQLRSSSANQRELPGLQAILENTIEKINKGAGVTSPSIATISKPDIIQGREYKLIDFYLPGMIGFSLIGSAVFGVAFLFYSLRETLVLKRLYASPIRKRNIILGETLSRIIFQLFTVVILILFGTFFYHFTLANGIETFLNMLVVSTLAVLVFMGVGFIISSVAKNQNVIPIYSNLFMIPQYFLSGTFFSKAALPNNIQWLIKILPLTALNDSLRKISFEGAHITSCGKEIGVLAIWGIIVYAIAIKVFRWE
ncbi:ABC transporter permease [Ferruginibacter albus]|uniref:ABC transporter permease n=1 Tax=Ferruginibacter albus TaxID=2875540 RepID=UPI001CC741DA|nr:ABC transporter permease [Ferruginibacter albus]UAY51440.1 ABC transporter permease [Ferruginibacter albus]